MSIGALDAVTAVAATAAARWMLDRIVADGRLSRDAAVAYLEATYGRRLIYVDSYGERSVAWIVLDAFRSLTGATVAWNMRDKSWHDLYPDAAWRSSAPV
jgi:hypothetical protein